MSATKIYIQDSPITILTVDKEDYISLTDMAHSQLQEHIIFKWMSLKNTIEYLGEWEALYNPDFNYTEFGTIRNMAGSNNFVLSTKTWIERTMLEKPKLSPLLREIAPSAEQVFRDQYVMEFIGGNEYKTENSMKSALIQQMKEFILELGKDFIFIDEEYRLQVGNSDFRIDLLFFHRELQCLVAFELKMGSFKPEHLGQLNFYLEALDRDVKKPHENPSIGILLCKDKDNEVVEYALSRSLSPTMVAEYKLCLPDKKLLQAKMREIEAE